MGLLRQSAGRGGWPRPAGRTPRALPRAVSGWRQRVVPGPSVVLGGPPFGLDVAVQQQSLQGGVQRALADLEHIPRDILQALRDSVAVQRIALEDPKDQHLERARQQP